VLDPVSAAGLPEFFNQIAIGATMGLVMQIAMAAIVVAGQSIATSMGLSMANMLDPNMGNVPVISQLFIVMASLIFVGFGGHAMLLGMISDSFVAMPSGNRFCSQRSTTSCCAGVRWCSWARY